MHVEFIIHLPEKAMAAVSLEGRIETNFYGYKKLIQLYRECAKFNDETINLDFYRLIWIDANLCSLLEAILHKLIIENNLSFSTDFAFIHQNFDVLLRNGFIDTGNTIIDTHKSTIPFKSFDMWNKEAFCTYIDEDLLTHRGMPALKEFVKDKIAEDLIEVFSNSHLHANTTYPFFVAGQYYPKSEVLKFTMVDLGDGFLPKIKERTGGEISTSLEAIDWALKGNTTKLDAPGALGISGMWQYCKENGGIIDIITGDGYWSSDYESTIFMGGRELLDHSWVGTTINLTFKQ